MTEAPTDPPADSAAPAPRRPPNPRQTLSYLSNLLASQGLRPKRRLGQNFLVDLNLLDLLVRSSGVGRSDVVLEVGAGTGGLTTRLAEVAGRVVSVEIDAGFHRLVHQEVRTLPNVALLHADALAGKNRVEPAVLAAVRDAMQSQGVDHYHLVANLPYDVAASLIANLILNELEVRTLTFTVQWEVAMRILAEPGRGDYGPLAVLVQTVGSARLIRTLRPSVFWPRPKVDSAFVRILVDPERKRATPDLADFHNFVRRLFIHRRKNLRGSVLSVPEYKPLKTRLPDLLAEVGLDRDDRAEALDPPTLQRLFRRLQEALRTESHAGDD
jgi:16S rRNA (adenine1518-N6/adenine1519-N6)-dimethyltransferase